jgi:hypothetical protein
MNDMTIFDTILLASGATIIAVIGWTLTAELQDRSARRMS